MIKWIVFVSLLFAVSISWASPTENEFEHCDKKAVLLLERCLNDSAHNGSSECWNMSYTGFNKCIDRVRSSHDRNKNRIESEKKKQARMLILKAQ